MLIRLSEDYGQQKIMKGYLNEAVEMTAFLTLMFNTNNNNA